jgi:proteasome accessory factor A
VLDDLAADYWRCRDRVDWVAKKYLLTTFRESEGLEWSDPWLQSIDLEYHNVSLENGLYYELMREGQMRRVVSEDDIRRAIFQPPETTRAFFRGRAVARFNREIESIQWDEMVLGSGNLKRNVELAHPAHDAGLDRLNAAIRDAKTFEELVQRLG